MWFCKIIDFFNRLYNNIEIHHKIKLHILGVVQKMPMNRLGKWSIVRMSLFKLAMQ